MKIKVLIADDHALFRQGLAALIAEVPELELVAEAADGEAAVRRVLELAPRVAVLDVGMANLNGIDATLRIAAEAPGTRVLGLSMHADAGHVFSMLGAGAAGYVLKQDAFDELAAAIRAVARGERWLSPRLPELAPNRRPILSERELQVISMLADGASYKQIAAQLGVGVKTVETYRQRAATKLGAHYGAKPATDTKPEQEG